MALFLTLDVLLLRAEGLKLRLVVPLGDLTDRENCDWGWDECVRTEYVGAAVPRESYEGAAPLTMTLDGESTDDAAAAAA